MTSRATILIVDDDAAVGRVLAALLAQDGHQATLVLHAEAALVELERRSFDLVISDVRMPGMDGMQLLALIRKSMPEVPVVLLTAHGTVALAVEAMRAGAADFLLKPFAREEVLFVVKKALGFSAAERESPPAQASADGLVGASPALAEARELIAKASQSNASVLVLGETGTGKELVARAIHNRSARAKGPFVRVTGGALPDTLFESELFGYEKGAFTGAAIRKPGRVELAKGGTLFLDEVGELPLPLQVKLLRLLQEREFERLGGTETIKADVRIIAATHRPLEQMAREGTFREDLFYRLNVIPLVLPPLRARLSDVDELAKYFVVQLGQAHGRPKASIADDALPLLREQQWPGNVRQLQNFVERLVVLSNGDLLTSADVKRELARSGAPVGAASPLAEDGSLDGRRREVEKVAVEEALVKAKGNRSLAARLLGISRRSLYYKLEALEVK